MTSVFEQLLIDDPQTIIDLDDFNLKEHGQHISTPKLKPLKKYPDDMIEIDRTNREISKAHDIKRGKGW